MAKEVQYYRMNVMVSCGKDACYGNIYISGNNIEMCCSKGDSRLKKVESGIEEISKKEFERVMKKIGPLKRLG